MTKQKQNKKSPTELMIKIGQGQEMFIDERGTRWMVIERNGIQKNIPLESSERSECYEWLGGMYYKTHKQPTSRAAIRDAINHLRFEAAERGKIVHLNNRSAWVNDELFIDLKDQMNRSIKVNKQGWEIITTPPAMFKRHNQQKSLPVPHGGNNLDEFNYYFNVSDPDDMTLLVVWLCTSLLPHIPRPILCLHGAHGSAKTTAARLLKNLVDPSVVSELNLPSNQDQLAQMLYHHAVPLFDNVHKINQSVSDMLCRAVTGGAHSKRGLYTDEEDILFEYRRAIIMTGINLPTVNSDFLDRALLVEFKRISDEDRQNEAIMMNHFQNDASHFFGGILDVMVCAMNKIEQVSSDKLIRMADFHHWGLAVAEALEELYKDSENCLTGEPVHSIFENATDSFQRALERNVNRQHEEVLDSDPVGAAVLNFMANQSEWSGTMTELLAQLQPVGTISDWPADAKSLSRRINVLEGVFYECGITKSRRYKNGSPLIVLKKNLVEINSDTDDVINEDSAENNLISSEEYVPTEDEIGYQSVFGNDTTQNKIY